MQIATRQEGEVLSFTSSFITLHNLIYISQEERHTLSDVGTPSNYPYSLQGKVKLGQRPSNYSSIYV